MKVEPDFPLRDAKTGAAVSLNSLLNKFDDRQADFSDAATLWCHVAYNLLGMDFDKDSDQIAELLNWLIGHQTTITYTGSLRIYTAFERIVKEIESAFPQHDRRLRISHESGAHDLDEKTFRHFELLRNYLKIACEVGYEDC